MAWLDDRHVNTQSLMMLALLGCEQLRVIHRLFEQSAGIWDIYATHKIPLFLHQIANFVDQFIGPSISSALLRLVIVPIVVDFHLCAGIIESGEFVEGFGFALRRAGGRGGWVQHGTNVVPRSCKIVYKPNLNGPDLDFQARMYNLNTSLFLIACFPRSKKPYNSTSELYTMAHPGFHILIFGAVYSSSTTPQIQRVENG